MRVLCIVLISVWLNLAASRVAQDQTFYAQEVQQSGGQTKPVSNHHSKPSDSNKKHQHGDNGLNENIKITYPTAGISFSSSENIPMRVCVKNMKLLPQLMAVSSHHKTGKFGAIPILKEHYVFDRKDLNKKTLIGRNKDDDCTEYKISVYLADTPLVTGEHYLRISRSSGIGARSLAYSGIFNVLKVGAESFKDNKDKSLRFVEQLDVGHDSKHKEIMCDAIQVQLLESASVDVANDQWHMNVIDLRLSESKRIDIVKAGKKNIKAGTAKVVEQSNGSDLRTLITYELNNPFVKGSGPFAIEVFAMQDNKLQDKDILVYASGPFKCQRSATKQTKKRRSIKSRKIVR